MKRPASDSSAAGAAVGTADERDQPLQLDDVKIDPVVALAIPANLAIRRQVLPFARVDDVVYVAAADPDDSSALDAVQRFVETAVRVEPAEPAALARAIERIFSHPAPARNVAGIVEGAESIADSIQLSGEILSSAVLVGASDVHLYPLEDTVRLQMRVDGVLEPLRELSRERGQALVSRLKVMAGLDIAERRAPQDGKFRYDAGRGRSVDVRMATLPTREGERVTLRLLSLHREDVTLEALNMSPEQLLCFDREIHQPHGIILLTGPTGSGKSTTLYAAIQRLIRDQVLNVITIEDPVEYTIPGVSQVQVDHAQKVTFAKALRSALRHDPDVIMVGEIRDAETADVALKAALTGHMVLSTLHTNSAAGAITRLRDMGVPSYLSAAVLRMAVAQRLLRRLCPRCRRPAALTAAQAAMLGRPELESATAFEPGGCLYCANRGYVGRIAVFEMLPNGPEVAAGIGRDEDEEHFVGLMRSRDQALLLDDAVAKMLEGQTSLAQVLRHVLVQHGPDATPLEGGE